jgi:hypothetical protein
MSAASEEVSGKRRFLGLVLCGTQRDFEFTVDAMKPSSDECTQTGGGNFIHITKPLVYLDLSSSSANKVSRNLPQYLLRPPPIL